MRTFIDIVDDPTPERLLTEMPELISATDFSLIDPVTNLNLASRLMKANKTVIEEDNDIILFRTGNENGNIAMVDKRSQKIVYWVRFETKNIKEIGPSVTQVILWRDVDYPRANGITEKIFFDYLLVHWGAVISDGMQTQDGQRFWRRTMGQATLKNKKVGMFNMFAKTVNWYDGVEPYSDWISSQMKAWGSTNTHQGYRFVIKSI